MMVEAVYLGNLGRQDPLKYAAHMLTKQDDNWFALHISQAAFFDTVSLQANHLPLVLNRPRASVHMNMYISHYFLFLPYMHIYKGDNI